MNRSQFAKLKFGNDKTLNVNAQYIIYYAYDRDNNETVVRLIENDEHYFPGDQTEEIEASFRFVK